MNLPQCRSRRWLLVGLVLLGLAPAARPGRKDPGAPGDPGKDGPAVAEGTLPAEWVKALTWRSIGPANMGGRITAVSVYEADPSTYYVATASGGLLKTVNNGVTFQHQFDREP